jgi:hypothetical protein
MKDGYLITSVYFGNSLVDLYGYDNEIDYAYIGDENITEMLIELKVWDKVVEEAEEEIANGY